MRHKEAKAARDKLAPCKAVTKRGKKIGKRCANPGVYSGYCGIPSHMAQSPDVFPRDNAELKLCGANIKRRGKTCGHVAGYGTKHLGFGRCKWHGGSTANHQKAVQKEMAAEAVVTLGLPVKVSPEAALLGRLWALEGHVRYCEMVIRAMDPDEVIWAVTEHTQGGAASMPNGHFTVYSAAPNVWIDMYNNFTAQLINVSKVIIQCGLQARQVEIAEQHKALLLLVIEGTLSALGLKHDSPKVRAILGEQLRLASGAAEEVKL